MTDYAPNYQEGKAGMEAIVVTKIAAASISAFQTVKLASGDDEGKVTPTTAATDHVYGVALEDASADDAVKVCIFGRCKVIVQASSSNISVGDYLCASGTAGRAQKATTNGFPFAIAEHAATGDGDYILCTVGVAATAVA